MTEITVTYLEMNTPADLRLKPPPAGVTVAKVPTPMPALNRFFYTAIGGDYGWYERLVWTPEEWLSYLSRPGVETWVLSVEGIPAGYYELYPTDEGSVDVRLFGLLEPYVGKGHGGYLLTTAVRRAWEKGATKVTVDTCTLDHPTALSHYLARGFRIVGKKVKHEELTVKN